MYRARGFTLIELLVVIALIALLVAILVPVLRKARNESRAVVCQTNLSQWGTTLALLLEDYGGRFPSGSGTHIWILRGESISVDNPDEFKKYHPIGSKGIILCPMAVKPSNRSGGTFSRIYGSGNSSWHLAGKTGSTFAAWEITEPRPTFRGSYGFNTNLLSNMQFDYSSLSSLGSSALTRSPDIFSLRGRGNIPILLDCTAYNGEIRSSREPPSSESEALGFCINRHNAHINGLFLDWSARKIGLKELWTLKWSKDFDTTGPWTRAGGVQAEDWPEWMRNFKDY